MTDAAPRHPAPHRHRARNATLLACLAAGPVVWLIQMSINYGISSHGCYPAAEPLARLPSGAVWTVIIAITIVAIMISLAAALLSYRNWRMTRAEAGGDTPETIEAGEGRTRFLSLWGAFAGTGFAVALLFNLIGILGVPPCGYS